MDTSSPTFIAVVTAALVVAGVCLVISGLKGRYGLLFFGFLLAGLFGPQELYVLAPIVPLVGACRLAKPRSVWARRFYGDEKLDRARQRFA